MTFAMQMPARDILDARRKRVEKARQGYDVLNSI